MTPRWPRVRDDRLLRRSSVAHADAVYASYPNGPRPPEVSLAPALCDLSGQPLGGAPKRSWSLALGGRGTVALALGAILARRLQPPIRFLCGR